MNNVPKTIFFTACRAVFAGGGCRAAAHVGAFQAATEAGVNFSEVAGTSAGSIIAAIVGAGGSPEFLQQHLGTLAFSSLLAPPTGSSINTGTVGQVLKRVPFLQRKLIGKFAIYGGGFSSAKIEEWVDDRLAELLPKSSRPVKFNALLLPTTIVASDLSGSRTKVWSTSATPDDPVAFAVRCSCSIPIFFEPVALGNSRFVDGGLLSNLPAFVFPDQSSSGLGGRILGFRLQDDSKPPAIWNHSELLRSLTGTLVGGATELQASMRPDVNVISIPTGDIQATDFDINREQIAGLITNGREAVFDFIRDEAVYLRSNSQQVAWSADEDNFLAELVAEGYAPGTTLIVAMSDTTWFWRLFPTILAWCEAGASLKILVEAPHGSADSRAREDQRRGLLTALGATVVERPGLPFYGYFLLRSDPNREAAFIKNPSQISGAPYGIAYIGALHRPLMEILKQRLKSEFQQVQLGSETSKQCYLRLHPTDEIVDRLKHGVWQYNRPGVTITLEQVDLNRIQLLVRRIRTFKFIQISHLTRLYEKFNLPLFVPTAVHQGGNEVSVITPPVLEEWGKSLVAIEGNTRVYSFFKEGRSKIHALVVRGPTDQPPGRPVWPSQALLYTRSLESQERIAGFNFDQFRSIEGAVRPVLNSIE